MIGNPALPLFRDRTTIKSFLESREAALQCVRAVHGFLSEREARFLFLVGACAPAEGDVLEIGSFKGRSTVALASGVEWRGRGKVIAIDPHTSPSPTDPDLGSLQTSWDEFCYNIHEAKAEAWVEAHREFSHDFAPRFSGVLRALWIDGEHTTTAAHNDLELFKPFLAFGAIVVMHDVLGTWEGSLRVFVEDVLGSDDFGAAGFCGSIGWAQYAPGEGKRWQRRLQRSVLSLPARRLIPVAASGRGLVGLNKLKYKFWRPLAPHGEVNPKRWVRDVGIQGIPST